MSNEVQVGDGAANVVRMDASTLAEKVIAAIEEMGYAEDVAVDVGHAAEDALLMKFNLL